MDEEQEFLAQLFLTFRDEVEEYIRFLRSGLMELQDGAPDDPEQEELAHSLFRTAHNFKGSAGTLGLDGVSTLAHRLEDQMKRLRAGEWMTTEGFIELDNWIERLGEMVSEAPGLEELMELDVTPELDALDALEFVDASGAPSAAAQTDKPKTEAAEPKKAKKKSGAKKKQDTKRQTVEAPADVESPPESEPAPEVETAPQPEPPPEPEPQAAAKPEPKESAKTASGPESRGRGAGGDEGIIRLAPAKLDRLIATLGELMVAHGQSLKMLDHFEEWVEDLDEMVQESMTSMGPERREQYRTHMRRIRTLMRSIQQHELGQSSRMEDLADSGNRLRMQPLAMLFATFEPMVRKLARSQGKRLQLQIQGANTEVDRQVIERLKDPLMHLLRNAVDHGIELPEERSAAGKAEDARLELSASEQGGFLILTVSDDGCGISPARLRSAAVRKKLLGAEEAAALSDRQAVNLIFRPGFSSRMETTQTSGRGVGMDVVQSEITALNGRIEVNSTPGKGTRFHLFVPLSLSVISGLLVKVAGRRYVLPVSALDQTLRIRAGDLARWGTSLELPTGVIGLLDLARMLGGEPPSMHSDEYEPVVILHLGAQRRAVRIDSIDGQVHCVVKPFGAPLRRVRLFQGGTLLNDETVVPIFNPSDLLAAPLEARLEQAPSRMHRRHGTATERAHILVVDDSITTLTLEKTLLEQAGYKVTTAHDGTEALRVVRNHLFDCVITDVDMPQLNGFELTRQLKSDERTMQMPVIIVTGLGSPEEQRKGLECGADAYIVKKGFDQSQLLENIRRLT